MEKYQVELCGKLPFLGSSKEVNIDFQEMEIEAKKGLKNIPIFKVRGMQLFTMRYLMPILIIAVFLQIGLGKTGVIVGSLFYFFLSGMSGIFHNSKHINIILSILCIPVPLFFLYLSFNNVQTDFNIYELQGSLYAAFSGLLLFEFILRDVIHKKYNDIYRTKSLSNFIILDKEPKLTRLIFQKFIVAIVSFIVVFYTISELAKERANAVILEHKNTEARALLSQKIAAEKVKKREKVCHELDKKLKSDDFVKFQDEISFYGKHLEDENIIDYEILNINSGTKLMNTKTGEIHQLSNFKSGHFMKKELIFVRSDKERDFTIYKKGHFGIVKTFVNKEKMIAGNFYHIRDGFEQFIVLSSQAHDHGLARIDRKNLLKD